MIKIYHNGEIYTISNITRYGEEDLAFADYKSSVDDHVDNIKTLLSALAISYEEECS